MILSLKKELIYIKAAKRTSFTSITTKAKILNKTNGICVMCGEPLTLKTMTIDHYIPLSKGGMNRINNLYPSCEKCNQKKGNEIYPWEDCYKYISLAYAEKLDTEYNTYLNSIGYTTDMESKIKNTNVKEIKEMIKN